MDDRFLLCKTKVYMIIFRMIEILYEKGMSCVVVWPPTNALGYFKANDSHGTQNKY